MANVNPVDGIMYGFRLMGYILAVNVIGGLFFLVGLELDNVLGVLVALVGVFVAFAGILGIQYKIIADGVEQGVLASRGNAPESEGLSGLPFVNDRSRGRQQHGTPSGHPNQRSSGQQQAQRGQGRREQGDQGQRGQGRREQGNQGQREANRGQRGQGNDGDDGSSGRRR